MNIYMRTITINEDRVHEFVGEQRGVYRRVGREERKQRNVIKLLSQKINKNKPEKRG